MRTGQQQIEAKTDWLTFKSNFGEDLIQLDSLLVGKKFKKNSANFITSNSGDSPYVQLLCLVTDYGNYISNCYNLTHGVEKDVKVVIMKLLSLITNLENKYELI